MPPSVEFWFFSASAIIGFLVGDENDIAIIFASYMGSFSSAGLALPGDLRFGDLLGDAMFSIRREADICTYLKLSLSIFSMAPISLFWSTDALCCISRDSNMFICSERSLRSDFDFDSFGGDIFIF